ARSDLVAACAASSGPATPVSTSRVILSHSPSHARRRGLGRVLYAFRYTRTVIVSDVGARWCGLWRGEHRARLARIRGGCQVLCFAAFFLARWRRFFSFTSARYSGSVARRRRSYSRFCSLKYSFLSGICLRAAAAWRLRSFLIARYSGSARRALLYSRLRERYPGPLRLP